MRSSLLLLASLAFPALAGPPAHLELEWELLRDGATIAAVTHRVDLSAEGKYEISEAWAGRGLYRLLGQARRVSRGEVRPEGLRPAEYTDERTGRDPERASFDWSRGTVTYQYKGPPATVPLPAHATDELCALFGFAFSPPREPLIEQDVVTGRGISDRIFRNEGREKVSTPAGDFDAIRLVRRKDSGERAEIWLAADRSFLPVRILLVDRNGTRVDQTLLRVATTPARP